MTTITPTANTKRSPRAIARRAFALAVLSAAMLGVVGMSASEAQASECNNLFRSGHGYYGCGGIGHAWETGNYSWILYYW